MLLAGGLGIRLRPVVEDLPKSLASVAGRPFIEYLLAQLAAAGCQRAVVCSGFKSDVLEAHLGSGERYGLELVYSTEAEPRGTAGALKLAEHLLRGDSWLLMNGTATRCSTSLSSH
jgi:NDP-sugar pyrophosphorylase family protein